jgi:hypothetical protein
MRAGGARDTGHSQQRTAKLDTTTTSRCNTQAAVSVRVAWWCGVCCVVCVMVTVAYGGGRLSSELTVSSR